MMDFFNEFFHLHMFEIYIDAKDQNLSEIWEGKKSIVKFTCQAFVPCGILKTSKAFIGY